MQKRYPFREIISVVSTGGTYEYLKSKQVADGEIEIIETVAYENETTARGTFRRYIEKGDTRYYVAELQGPGAAELIFSDKTLTLLPGERLVVRQAVGASSDILRLYVTGYKIFTAEPYLEV